MNRDQVSEIKNLIKKHTVTKLSEGIQNFYNGECALIEIENVSNFSEVHKVIKEAYNSSSYFLKSKTKEIL